MKTLIITLAGLASAGAALAQVDPTRPMVTGRGNVSMHPQKLIVTNQTSTAPATSEAPVKLEKFQVTGSLLPKAAATPAPKK